MSAAALVHWDGRHHAGDTIEARAREALSRGNWLRARDLADIGLNGSPSAAKSATLLLARSAAELALGRLSDARASAERARSLAPEHAAAHGAVAAAVAALGMHAEAVAGYQRAAELDHEFAAWRAGCAAGLLELGELEAAQRAARAAFDLDPQNVDARLVLARLAMRAGQAQAAVAWLEPAVARAPERADLHVLLGVALAATGDVGAGLREYEWRQRLPGWNPRPFDIPAWDGGPLDGRRLLVWTEQGLGDSIQFVRFVREAHRRGAHVLFHGDARLVRLFRSCAGFAELLSIRARRPKADVHASLVSLPALLGVDREMVGASVPYLRAEPQLEQVWQQRIAARTTPNRPRVGLVWQGNAEFCDDDRRSCALAHLDPLVRAFSGRVEFLSLQKGFGQDQLQLLPDDTSIDDLGSELDGTGDAFVDSAAALSAIDLLLTTDTSIAHLAGACARPVWLMLSSVPDWRWGMAGTSTPWYQTMRIFRQAAAGDWRGLIAEVSAELERWLAALPCACRSEP